jgi:hypothetical protein
MVRRRVAQISVGEPMRAFILTAPPPFARDWRSGMGSRLKSAICRLVYLSAGE